MNIENSKLSGLLSNKKMRIKVIIAIIILIVLLFSIKPIKAIIDSKNALDTEQYTVLKSGKNINYIEAKGDVTTLNDSTEIYPSVDNQKLKVEKVNVKVGDKVNKGDTLAVLDSSDIEKQIQKSKEEINTSKANTSINLKAKEESYQSLLDKNQNSSDKSIIESEKNVNSAKIDLDDKTRVYEQKKVLSENNSITKEELIKSKEALDNADNTYKSAVSELESLKRDNETAIEQAKNEYDSAKAANDDKSKEIALSIQEKQLAECNITSPIDGTITVSNAKEGAPCGTANLFEIKDLENLIVKAHVKENDISKISIGQKVDITADSLNNETLSGKVISIDPTAEQEKDNPLKLDDDSDDDAEFTVKIQFDEYDERIMDGMNVNVNIILDEKEDTYKVPSSCILKNDDDMYVYSLEKDGEKYIVEQIPVTKGTENDTETEIDGQDIHDDLIILNSPSDYYEGQEINKSIKY